MKTDNLIKKSAKMPGVSLSRTDNSITLILKTREGNGSITFFPLFSSLMLAYISVSSPVWPAPCLYPSDLHGTETEKSGKENISDGNFPEEKAPSFSTTASQADAKSPSTPEAMSMLKTETCP